jgi:hypothetical protein
MRPEFRFPVTEGPCKGKEIRAARRISLLDGRVVEDIRPGA